MRHLFFAGWNAETLTARTERLPTCILDGRVKQCHYHAAALAGTRPYDENVFEWMGDGVIAYAGGVKMKGRTRLSFFKLKHDRPSWAK